MEFYRNFTSQKLFLFINIAKCLEIDYTVQKMISYKSISFIEPQFHPQSMELTIKRVLNVTMRSWIQYKKYIDSEQP